MDPDPDAAIPKVLVADDHPRMRALVAGALRKAGFDAVEVHDGEVLLTELASAAKDDDNPREADLIITDLRMPRCSGLQALEALSRDPRRPPIIVMTAFCDEQTERAAKALGAARIFSKPFSLEELVAAVRALLAAPA